MQRTTIITLFLSILIVIIAVAVGLTVFPAAKAETACVTDWSNSANKDQLERCGKLKYDQEQQQRQRGAQQPYATSPRTPDPKIVGTPVPRGYMPESAQRVAPVNQVDVVDILALRQADSVWQAGSVLDQEDGRVTLYVWAMTSGDGRQTHIGFFVASNDAALTKQYRREWQAPKVSGKLTITAISGPLVENAPNVISFITSIRRAWYVYTHNRSLDIFAAIRLRIIHFLLYYS